MSTNTGIVCPQCGGKTRIRSTVSHPGEIRRYRVCLRCGHRFHTTESRNFTTFFTDL